MRKTVGSKIRYYREQLGLSQEQLALDIGVAKPTISRIETGHNWPQYENLEAIAIRLGVSVANFFGEIPTPKPTVEQALEVLREATQAPKPAQVSQSEFSDVVEALREAPDEILAAVRALLFDADDPEDPGDVGQGLGKRRPSERKL